MNDTLRDKAARIESDKPVAVSYAFYGEGGGWESPVYGEEAVSALYQALCAVTVTGTTQMTATDSDAYYTFIYADGTEDSFHFNLGNLDVGDVTYTVEGDKGLGDVAFPTYGRYRSLTETHPDAAYRAFADAFYDDTPVSLLVTAGLGGPFVTEDAAVIKEAFQALSYAELAVCDTQSAPGPDGDGATPVRVFAFTMADGTTYTYTFEGKNMVYEFPAPIGTRYYWAGDTLNALFDLFAPAS